MNEYPTATNIHIGTAAWNLPKEVRGHFPQEGSILEKYSTRFNCVEINSSFYRDHKPETYERWAATVPDDFRFAVKLSKLFTHEQRLERGEADMASVLDGIQRLGPKWAVLLIQLPPSLYFHAPTARRFFDSLRDLYDGNVAFEPRHISWNFAEALEIADRYRISRVNADPESIPNVNFTKTSEELVYYRLHGSPKMYKSDYDRETLYSYARRLLGLAPSSQHVWCIFDNTTYGYATTNAMTLQDNLSSHLTW